MKLIYKNYIKFLNKKLFYLKGENCMITKILSLKEDAKSENLNWNFGKK